MRISNFQQTRLALALSLSLIGLLACQKSDFAKTNLSGLNYKDLGSLGDGAHSLTVALDSDSASSGTTVADVDLDKGNISFRDDDHCPRLVPIDPKEVEDIQKDIEQIRICAHTGSGTTSGSKDPVAIDGGGAGSGGAFGSGGGNGGIAAETSTNQVQAVTAGVNSLSALSSQFVEVSASELSNSSVPGILPEPVPMPPDPNCYCWRPIKYPPLPWPVTPGTPDKSSSSLTVAGAPSFPVPMPYPVPRNCRYPYPLPEPLPVGPAQAANSQGASADSTLVGKPEFIDVIRGVRETIAFDRCHIIKPCDPRIFLALKQKIKNKLPKDFLACAH